MKHYWAITWLINNMFNIDYDYNTPYYSNRCIQSEYKFRFVKTSKFYFCMQAHRLYYSAAGKTPGGYCEGRRFEAAWKGFGLLKYDCLEILGLLGLVRG